MAAQCGPEGERILLPAPCGGCTTPSVCTGRAQQHCNFSHKYGGLPGFQGSTRYNEFGMPIQVMENMEAKLPGIPDGAKERKTYPIATGVIDYFPNAIAAIAHLSFIGNEQHNPGTKLHWDRSKSGDEADALMRHFVKRGTLDTDSVRHSTKVAWRALALLEKEIERESGPKPGEWKKV